MAASYELVDTLNLLSQIFQIIGIILCVTGLVLSFGEDRVEKKKTLKKMRIIRAAVLVLALLMFLGTVVTKRAASEETAKIINEYNNVLTE